MTTPKYPQNTASVHADLWTYVYLLW